MIIFLNNDPFEMDEMAYLNFITDTGDGLLKSAIEITEWVEAIGKPVMNLQSKDNPLDVGGARCSNPSCNRRVNPNHGNPHSWLCDECCGMM